MLQHLAENDSMESEFYANSTVSMLLEAMTAVTLTLTLTASVLLKAMTGLFRIAWL